jgi:hypothetical protein
MPADGQIACLIVDISCIEQAEKKGKERKDGGLLDLLAAHRRNGTRIYLRLPPVMRRDTIRKLFAAGNPDDFAADNTDDIAGANPAGIATGRLIEKISPDGFVAGSLDGIASVREYFPGCRVMTDMQLPFFNAETAAFYDRYGVSEHILSVELHRKESMQLLMQRKAHTFILPVYGHIPVMETAGCILKTNNKCLGGKKQEGSVTLLDRQNKQWPVGIHCERCENTIYNSVPLSLHRERKAVMELSPDGILLSFTVEDADTTRRLFYGFAQLYSGDACQAAEECADRFPKEFTKGHFLKGVE